MRLDIGARGSGKTTRMIEWLTNTPGGVLVVASEAERMRLIQQLGLSPLDRQAMSDRIVSPTSIHKIRGKDCRVGVDQMDWVLSRMLGVEIEIGTI